ncbi:hypothetical protein K504DRAFT_404411 [Pleomassaria siparia CBS 279.74]|uniref:Uncharacterized protein n=1 Tax=Pleomassaria siparia CBS 279.74 TaxID=1314801 RepID=A0A6G1KEF5_9PLEO|nr:hypothetical protein K504DRAFT_404411 [Pleomassaria siparia CBS 279.74]
MVTSNFIDSTFLLAIPTELRLAIYDYCLADTNTITITAAPVTVFGHRIKDRARKTPIPGLPLDVAPLVRHTYDPSLLSVSNPPTISLDHGNDENTISTTLPYNTTQALLKSCRFIHDELSDYMRKRSGRKGVGKKVEGGLSLYVSYPYGVLVLNALYLDLVKQAKNIYISGYYMSPPTSKPAEPVVAPTKTADLGTPLFNSSFFAPMRLGSPPLQPPSPSSRSQSQMQQREETRSELKRYPAETADTAPAALAALISTMLPPTPTSNVPLFQKLEARILFPGADSYKAVWGDDNGPVVQMLRNTCGGKIDMEVSRGNNGNAVMMRVQPNPRSRIVSTTWRMLGRERVEGFVIGKAWGYDGEDE